jgi:hypothetical protein
LDRLAAAAAALRSARSETVTLGLASYDFSKLESRVRSTNRLKTNNKPPDFLVQTMLP